MKFSVTPRVARLAVWITIPVAMVASGLAVGSASYSAFSATTSNPASNWTAGSVALSDDDSNTALFTATNLKPGSTAQNCITVTSSGSLASGVKLYAVSPTTTNALSSSLTFTVEQGTGGGFGSCSGFTPAATSPTLYTGTMAAFSTASTNFATGLGTWTPTGTASESRVFRVTYTLSAAAPNSVQAGTASMGLTWEAQNS